MGWVDSQLVDPLFHFHYFGFSWIEPLPRIGMYLVFVALLATSLAITLGAFYRFTSITFFLLFTYVELIDISFYLNHYYFVSIVAFLLIWVPANKSFSIDVLRDTSIQIETVPRWTIGIFKLQIAIVYIYAGLAKINYDWLVKALPLSIWLPAKTSIPLIGPLFKYKATAFIFSWAGMLFDTFIIFFLMIKRTRWFAYIAVVIFHTLTGILFQIGIFPLVMVFAVTIFFSEKFHLKVITLLKRLVRFPKIINTEQTVQFPGKTSFNTTVFLSLFFTFQLLFPWRYLLYEGNIFWTEEGYRFSWRVMLMEKAGTATLYVKDGDDGREGSVINSQFLTPHQEKQMAMQPDMILQYAHFLDDYYKTQGLKNPQIRAEALVTLNARPAQHMIDPKVDLTKKTDGFARKDWIIPFNENH